MLGNGTLKSRPSPSTDVAVGGGRGGGAVAGVWGGGVVVSRKSPTLKEEGLEN
jgi:hypothetical protein